MGYYSLFSLELEGHKNNTEFLTTIASLRESLPYAESCLDEYGECSYQEGKWYDLEDGLKVFSKHYPHILFIMSVTGEGDGLDIDIWKCYCKAGKSKVVKPVIVWPEVKEGDLT